MLYFNIILIFEAKGRTSHNQTNKSIFKGTPHNTPVILSPRVSHRPTTVNASLFDPKAHFIESAKHFKNETYLSRLLKTENKL